MDATSLVVEGGVTYSDQYLAMTPPEPARLIGFFAHGSPVCVIARRGPTRYTRIIRWETDRDVFTPGQWFRGRADFATLSFDGKYMALGIMKAARNLPDDIGQVAVVCKPPFVTGIEAWEYGLCMSGLAFLPGDILTIPRGKARHRAKTPCPFKRIFTDEVRHSCDHDWVIDASNGPASGIDHFGRKIVFEAGCVYAETETGRTLLYDTNPMKFEPIIAPDWACDW